MSRHGISGRDESSPFSELVTLLRESCEAVTRLQGGDTYYAEEVAIFKQIAKDQGHFSGELPEELERPCDDSGNEHEVWYREKEHVYLKASWPDNFGLKVIHRAHEEQKSSPIDYLERWLLHNEIFGDSVEFIGAIETAEGMRLLISQPAISGEPATVEQINAFFIEKGWVRIEVDGDVAYYDPEQKVVISDSHQGNIIALENGLLPIDLRVQQLTPVLYDIVENLLDEQGNVTTQRRPLGSLFNTLTEDSLTNE